MSTTSFTKLISLMAYDAALTERTDDYYLRVKTMPQTIDLQQPSAWERTKTKSTPSSTPPKK